ncbi:MAG TPA: ABC transporter permease [Thermoplasmata archaeon]|nr:ABC transporter permease [Thermoplasmata archaeon]
MKKLLAETFTYGKQYLRTRIGAFFTFIFPVLLILLFGAVFTSVGTSTISLPVQDKDGSTLSHLFLSSLNDTGVVKVSMVPDTEDLQSYVRANSLSVALLIPAGLEANASACAAANGRYCTNLTLYGDPSRSTYMVAQGVVEAVVEQMNFALTARNPAIKVDSRQVVVEGFTAIDFFLPGIVGMTVMVSSMYFMTGLCAEYRSRKYFKLLATTTLTKAEWLASRFLWFSMILLISLALTVAAGVALWNVHVTLNAFAAASVFILAGTFMLTSLGMLLGSAVKDPESASAVANAIGFPMMFLSGSFWALETTPFYLQAVAKVLPLTYLNSGLRDSMVYGNMNGALVNLAVVVVLGVVFFVLGSKLMSWKER